jgi:rhodanese-related sulfurtransferase
MNALNSLGLALLLSLSAAVQAEVTHINNEKTSELLAEGIPLIDVRTQSEWKQTGIVEGSHLLTFFDEKGNYDIKKWVAGLEEIAGKDKPFMLICAVGGRTGNISQFLDQKMGFTKVHNVERGIVQWLSANKPVAAYKAPEAEVATESNDAKDTKSH